MDQPKNTYDTIHVPSQEYTFLPQSLPISTGLTVRELVQLGQFPWRGTWGRQQETDHKIIATALEQVSMSDYADQFIEDLSGGDR